MTWRYLFLTACLWSLPVAGLEPTSVEKASTTFPTCDGSFRTCVAACSLSGKGECLKECAWDCEVCALDMGEEIPPLCGSKG